MGLISSFLVLAAGSIVVLASPYEKNGIIYDRSPEPAKAVHEVRDVGVANAVLAAVASCANSYNLFTTGTGPAPTGRPDPDYDYLSFCQAFIQATKTVTSIRWSSTTVNVPGTTATVTATTKSTSVIVGDGTATVTCAKAAPSMICGQGGWGYAENNIFTGSGVDPITCHEQCLANPACLSFQVETNSTASPQTCNLYKVDPSGNNTIASPAAPFNFYSRNCPDHLPAACGGPAAPSNTVVTIVPPPTTTASASGVINTPTNVVTAIIPPPGISGAVVGRAEALATLPWFLQPFGSSTMSEICSCIYTKPVPATTVLGILPKTTTVYISQIAKTVTVIVTTITTVGNGGPVTSVS